MRDRARLDRAVVIALAAGLCGVLVPLVLALVGVDFLNTQNLLPALPTLLAS